MTSLDMTSMEIKNRSINKIPKKKVEWWEDYEESMTITEKVWVDFQEIPKKKSVFATQITAQVNKDKNFKYTKDRRIREAIQDLLTAKRIKMTGKSKVNGRIVKLYERI